MTPVNKRRVVITGSEGFIGSHLKQCLLKEGYDVWGIDRVSKPEFQVIQADLHDSDETEKAIKACMPFSVIIHTAALAHGQNIGPDDSYERINAEMTANVLKALDAIDVSFIFFSSVAVYGEDKRVGETSVNDDLRPSTDYGKSKLACEKLVMESGLEDYEILRLAPVYDEHHMKDVKKRVFLPGPIKLKARFIPSPSHSLCHVDTIARTVASLASEACVSGKLIQNVADSKAYTQNDLLSWFPGKSMTLPTIVFKPFYYLSYLLPSKTGYSIRCIYWKLLNSNTYTVKV